MYLKSAFVSAALLAAMPANATVIDFTDKPLGVTHGNIGGPYAIFLPSTGAIYVGAAGIAHEICAYENFSCDAPLGVLFAQPVFNLTFQVSGVQNLSQLFISGQATSGSFELFYNITEGAWVDLSGYRGVSELSLGSNDPAGVSYNYFTFGQQMSAVPEPSVWTTLVMGLGMVGAMMRRRKPALGRMRHNLV